MANTFNATDAATAAAKHRGKVTGTLTQAQRKQMQNREQAVPKSHPATQPTRVTSYKLATRWIISAGDNMSTKKHMLCRNALDVKQSGKRRQHSRLGWWTAAP